MPTESIEARAAGIGAEILDRIERARSADFQTRLNSDPLYAWTQRGAKFMSDVFRFIDVYPALGNDDALMESLNAYVDDPGALFTDGGKTTPDRVRVLIRNLKDRFIAGEMLDDALNRCAELRASGSDFTLDILGEAVLSPSEEDHYTQAYIELIPEAAAAARNWPGGAEVNCSLKLTSLYSRFDPIDIEGSFNAVAPRLRKIFQLARQHGASINVDMEQCIFKDMTFAIFKRVLSENEFRDWSGVSITIQTYLADWLKDMDALAAWARERGAPVSVRLVKGAYWDHEVQYARYRNWPVPVFTSKDETDAAFEAGIKRLLDHREWLRPAIASHNIRSIACALARAEAAGLKKDGLDLQMLYGMGEEARNALTVMGHKVRVYAPFGPLRPGMAYLVRRLLEATSRSAFLRAMWRSPLPREELLRGPRNKPSAASSAQVVSRNEPAADFSKSEMRSRMSDAISLVKHQLGAECLLHIGGKAEAGEEIMTRENPGAKSETVGRVHLASRRQAAKAVRTAAKAFADWSNVHAHERAGLLRRAAAIMRERRFELAAWEMFECAKAWREADADVAEAIDHLEFNAAEIIRLSEPRTRNVPGERNSYFYAARGPALAITPWNFPLAILTGVVSAAVAAGNSVIMKPASPSSITAAKLMDIWNAAGAPPGVVQYVPASGAKVGEFMVKHPQVAIIAFTGSLAVGSRINQLASRIGRRQRHIKKVIAELGGKNAIIVDRDADLDQAVPGMLASAFGYQGQKCSACARALVVEELYEEFLKRLVDAAAGLPVGPAWDPHAAIGPVITAEAAARIGRYIQTARESGTVAFEGDVRAFAELGHYVPPVIVRDVDPKSPLAQEEIFGPVLSVMPVRDFSDAVRVANDVPYGLTGGLYSRNPRNIAAAQSLLQAGNIYVNRAITGALVDRQPFGGIKLSGIGSKPGGPDYLLQFMQPKTFTEYTVRRGFSPNENI